MTQPVSTFSASCRTSRGHYFDNTTAPFVSKWSQFNPVPVLIAWIVCTALYLTDVIYIIISTPRSPKYTLSDIQAKSLRGNFAFSHVCYLPPSFEYPNNICCSVQIMQLFNFLHPFVTFSSLGPNVLVNTLLPDPAPLCRLPLEMFEFHSNKSQPLGMWLCVVKSSSMSAENEKTRL
jgi:hypothetical protein